MAELFLYAAIVQGAIAAVVTFLGAFGTYLGLPVAVIPRVIRNADMEPFSRNQNR